MKNNTSGHSPQNIKRMLDDKRKSALVAKKERQNALGKQQRIDMQNQAAARKISKQNLGQATRPQGGKTNIWATGKIDTSFLIIVLLLLAVGLVMMFSASYPSAYSEYGDSFHYIKRQLIFAIVGVAAMFFLSKVDYRIWLKLAVPLYVVAVLLLILALVQPRSSVFEEEFKRWINLGPISFQPSEIAKLAIIVIFSSIFARNQFQMDKFSISVAVPLLLLGIICALTISEPHLSATIIMVMIGFLLMFIAGLKIKYLLGAGIIAAAGVLLALALGAVSYVTDRLGYWLDPWDDPLDKGFQTIQSLYAIGSGGLFGKGFGQSQQKYLWLPEPQNDFVFSIVVEELGFIGGVVILIMFAFLVWRGLTIASKSKDLFGTLLATGLVVQVGLQTILNIYVVSNTIPNTGISLPFFSYGGTSLMLLLAEMGIVLSISRESSLTKL